MNWNHGPFLISGHEVEKQIHGIWSTLFNATYLFSTPGTNRGDWFVPSVENAKQIASVLKLFPEEYLKKALDDYTYRKFLDYYAPSSYRSYDKFIYTSEDCSPKFSICVSLNNVSEEKVHKILDNSRDETKIVFPFACIEVID